jgi:hypothetical protein
MTKKSKAFTGIVLLITATGCASGPRLAKPAPAEGIPGAISFPCLPSPDDKDCKRRADRACPGGHNNYEYIGKSAAFAAGERIEHWTIKCHPEPERDPTAACLC